MTEEKNCSRPVSSVSNVHPISKNQNSPSFTNRPDNENPNNPLGHAIPTHRSPKSMVFRRSRPTTASQRPAFRRRNIRQNLNTLQQKIVELQQPASCSKIDDGTVQEQIRYGEPDVDNTNLDAKESPDKAKYLGKKQFSCAEEDSHITRSHKEKQNIRQLDRRKQPCNRVNEKQDFSTKSNKEKYSKQLSRQKQTNTRYG